METFKKRQKEKNRMERQRDKAAKRKEIKARKAAGLPTESDTDIEAIENAETAENAAASDEPTDPSTTN
jgi:hypothetical protein